MSKGVSMDDIMAEISAKAKSKMRAFTSQGSAPSKKNDAPTSQALAESTPTSKQVPKVSQQMDIPIPPAKKDQVTGSKKRKALEQHLPVEEDDDLSIESCRDGAKSCFTRCLKIIDFMKREISNRDDKIKSLEASLSQEQGITTAMRGRNAELQDLNANLSQDLNNREKELKRNGEEFANMLKDKDIECEKKVLIIQENCEKEKEEARLLQIKDVAKVVVLTKVQLIESLPPNFHKEMELDMWKELLESYKSGNIVGAASEVPIDTQSGANFEKK